MPKLTHILESAAEFMQHPFGLSRSVVQSRDDATCDATLPMPLCPAFEDTVKHVPLAPSPRRLQPTLRTRALAASRAMAAKLRGPWPVPRVSVGVGRVVLASLLGLFAGVLLTRGFLGCNGHLHGSRDPAPQFTTVSAKSPAAQERRIGTALAEKPSSVRLERVQAKHASSKPFRRSPRKAIGVRTRSTVSAAKVNGSAGRRAQLLEEAFAAERAEWAWAEFARKRRANESPRQRTRTAAASAPLRWKRNHPGALNAPTKTQAKGPRP